MSTQCSTQSDNNRGVGDVPNFHRYESIAGFGLVHSTLIMETGGTRSSLDVCAKVSTITWVKPKRDDDRNAHSTHHLVPRENVYPPHSARRLVDTSAKTPTRCLPPDNTGPSQGGSMVPSLADNAARSRVNSAPREIPNLGAPSRSLARSRLSGLRKQKKPAPPGQTRAPTGFRVLIIRGGTSPGVTG